MTEELVMLGLPVEHLESEAELNEKSEGIYRISGLRTQIYKTQEGMRYSVLVNPDLDRVYPLTKNKTYGISKDGGIIEIPKEEIPKLLPLTVYKKGEPKVELPGRIEVDTIIRVDDNKIYINKDSVEIRKPSEIAENLYELGFVITPNIGLTQYKKSLFSKPTTNILENLIPVIN